MTASGRNVTTRSRSLNAWQEWRKIILLHVGNDIVDLTDPHNRGKSRNTRFINRVFTINERKQIFDATDPDTILWALWGGKETAYKIVSKRYASVPSVPRLYEVTLHGVERSDRSGEYSSGGNFRTGFVDTPYERIYIRIFTTRDYVHSVGTTSSSEAIHSVVWQISGIDPDAQNSPDYESMHVRKALIKHLSKYIDENPEDIVVKKSKGANGLEPPFVYINGRRAEVDISLSHDGLFTAYAFSF
ncbi:MAG: 4-phosphopantetheinyl transferase family protein [Deltaproteobacteria bacterium]|nr:4-phosphopantetheinyl transferase family protein [Deltaproteobacteria bacterium]